MVTVRVKVDLVLERLALCSLPIVRFIRFQLADPLYLLGLGFRV